MNGIEATRRILADQPDVGVIMLTMLEDDDSLFTAMRAGARGYILKGADKAEMLQTVTAVAEGQTLFKVVSISEQKCAIANGVIVQRKV